MSGLWSIGASITIIGAIATLNTPASGIVFAILGAAYMISDSIDELSKRLK